MGITINIIYIDQDLIELKVQASNGHFKGETKLYANHDSLTAFAKAIKGFPSSVDDNREFSLGNFDPKYGGGGAKFAFRFYSRTGTTVVEIKLSTDEHASNFDISESAHFVIPIETAAIDQFVKQLFSSKVEVGASATLQIAT